MKTKRLHGSSATWLGALFFVGLLLGSATRLQAQEINEILQPEDSTYELVNLRLSNYWADNPPRQVGEEADNDPMHQFYKWAHFWDNRLGPNGDAASANAMMTSFIEGGLQVCDSELDSDIYWRSLGPFNSDGALGEFENDTKSCSALLPGHQNQGMITSLDVNPNDENDILAGGRNGGIWRSRDGGQNWYNTTYDEGYSIVGVSKIIRHPQNDQIIYVATSSSIGVWNFGHSYGVGVIRSDDGGESWSATGHSPTYGANGQVFSLAIDPNSTVSNTILYAGTVTKLLKWEGDAAATGNWTTMYENSTWYSGSTWYEGNFYYGRADFRDVEVESNGDVWFSNIEGLFRLPAGGSAADVVAFEDYDLPAIFPISFVCDGVTRTFDRPVYFK
ncbi:MAG: hypothetical protein AAFP19_14940, partial [Bacteroidota bacterium]